MTVEDVVAEYQRARPAIDEFLAYEKCLRDTFGLRLNRVFEFHSPALAVAKQFLETRRVLWRGDDQNFVDPGEHQRAQGVIDHRLVVDPQQLPWYELRHPEEAHGATSSQDYGPHGSPRFS